MTDNEVNTLKTDVALIKKDINHIEKVFEKVEHAVYDMTQLHKISAVQETILENAERRIENLEDAFVKHNAEELEYRKELNKTLTDMREDAQIQRERRHKEVLESIQNMHTTLSSKLDVQDKRIRALEDWRWWILGASGAIMFIFTQYKSFISFFD
jgi:predicted RNase H-like nuclease (RuvC/YqgF family)